ncbi:MAG TPA: GNAT family N-acetyltransferase [Caulobacteraceae bacterium]|jgi:GNAT superfamily N-acetyltransferase
MPITFEPAARFSMDDLAAVWRAAYEGYYVDLPFDAGQLARHVLWTAIDLDLSLVGIVDGGPFGLSLAARDGDEAWIGGFGVGVAHRRRGLATQLIAAQAARLDAAGIARTRLECIDVNPAREVYGRCSFETVRNLLVFDCVAAEAGTRGVDLDRATLRAAHERLHIEPPSWRRSLPRLERICDDLPAFVIGVERGGEVAAYAALLDMPDRFAVFDAAADDEAAARDLLSAIAAVRPGVVYRVVDEPSSTPLARVLIERDTPQPLSQVEMVRRR